MKRAFLLIAILCSLAIGASAQQKVSDLSAVTTLDGTELLLITKTSGAANTRSRKMTVADFTTAMSAAFPSAAADGATKGLAGFTAADFNASSGIISLDYTNAQKATGSVPGFLSAADWTTFNGKLSSGGALGTPSSGVATNLTGYVFANLASKPTTLSGYGITDAETVANKDTDVNLAANSDVKYASQKAVKAYVDSGLAGKQAAGSYVMGTLTPGTVPVAIGAGALGDSRIQDDGTKINALAGGFRLTLNGSGDFPFELVGSDIAIGDPAGDNNNTLLHVYDEDRVIVADALNFNAGDNGGNGNSTQISIVDDTKIIKLQSAGTVSLGDVDNIGTRVVVDAVANTFTVVGNHLFDKVITAPGTTGAQTINLVTGAVNFAAAATSLVVTNSLVDANSVIICTVGTNDTTMKSVACVVGSGSFTIFPSAAPTAETRVYFRVSN